MNDSGIDAKDVWVSIPVYNNSQTILQLTQKACSVWPNVIVVDDGSTDADLKTLLADTKAIILSHPVNMGKGQAIMTASGYAEGNNGIFLITIDGDGQHDPLEIIKFIHALDKSGDKLVIGNRDFSSGNIPKSSRFGREFSNFWVRLETGIEVGDSQSGFRAYPVKILNRLKINTSAYDFEIESLVKLAWSGVKIISVPVSVIYPEGRISHFKIFRDNTRLAVLHTKLFLRQLFFPLPHKKHVSVKKEKEMLKLFSHPKKLLKIVLYENASSSGLAMSAFVGIFIAVLPIFGFHTLAILYICARLHLNKILSIGIQNFFAPPLIPALCIYIGYYLRTGTFLKTISYDVVFNVNRIYEWFLGSLVVAPIAAVLGFIAVFYISKIFKQKNKTEIK